MPRLDYLDLLAPQYCLTSGFLALQRHCKFGNLIANEIHTEQLLEGVSKLFANYGWCIKELSVSPSLIKPIFGFELADFDETFNN